MLFVYLAPSQFPYYHSICILFLGAVPSDCETTSSIHWRHLEPLTFQSFRIAIIVSWDNSSINCSTDQLVNHWQRTLRNLLGNSHLAIEIQTSKFQNKWEGREIASSGYVLVWLVFIVSYAGGVILCRRLTVTIEVDGWIASVAYHGDVCTIHCATCMYSRIVQGVDNVYLFF